VPRKAHEPQGSISVDQLAQAGRDVTSCVDLPRIGYLTYQGARYPVVSGMSAPGNLQLAKGRTVQVEVQDQGQVWIEEARK
jgi:hypothetical protein